MRFMQKEATQAGTEVNEYFRNGAAHVGGDEDADYKDDEDADVEEDNSTLLEEEALISSNKDEKKRIDDEVNALKDESEMPIEELMKRYGYGHENHDAVGSSNSSSSSNAKLERNGLQNSYNAMLIDESMVSNSNHSDDAHGDEDADYKDDEDADVEEDNSTLLEEEALISSNKDEKKRIDDEVNALKDESEMPIEELMKRYGYGHENHDAVGSSNSSSSSSSNAKLERNGLQKADNAMLIDESMVSNSNHSDDAHGDEDADYKDDEDADVEEDNSTLLEEEALISSNKDEKKRIDDEVNALKDESEMPIEELMKRYGYGHENQDAIGSSSSNNNAKLEKMTCKKLTMQCLSMKAWFLIQTIVMTLMETKMLIIKMMKMPM